VGWGGLEPRFLWPLEAGCVRASVFLGALGRGKRWRTWLKGGVEVLIVRHLIFFEGGGE
jgi:hypothetical protein